MLLADNVKLSNRIVWKKCDHQFDSFLHLSWKGTVKQFLIWKQIV